jgi:DNA-binding transcriptional ArsR family regulator
MRTTRVLDVLMPRTRQHVLGALLLRPDKGWFGRELARHLGLQPSSLQRELAALTEAGILKQRREGRQVYYQADPDCPILRELQGLLLKTAGLVDVLRESLKPLARGIACAFVYGSVARAEELSDSDVDLFLVGEVKPSALSNGLEQASQRLARTVNPTVMDSREFARCAQAKDRFVLSVLERPKLFVVGSSRELDEAAGRAADRPGGRRPG